MNKNLTYKLIYTPSRDGGVGVEETNINFLCTDKRLHIRLREYTEEEVISGFIAKLTYLITYLVNYTNNTEESEVFINSIIENAFHQSDFKGVKIYPCYRRLKNYSKKGYIPNTVCPVHISGNNYCSLDYFLETFRLNLHEYLFNDAYEIVITKDETKNLYSKYLNKSNNERKPHPKKDDRVVLW